MTQTAEKILSITVMRDLFPQCFYCAVSIAETPFGQLVKVDGRNRLAHVECPEEPKHAA